MIMIQWEAVGKKSLCGSQEALGSESRKSEEANRSATQGKDLVSQKRDHP